MSRRLALVGAYAQLDGEVGGVSVVEVRDDADTLTLTVLDRVGEPTEAGYLVHDPRTQRVYVVDERKTDGRGPVGPPAAIHEFALDPVSGRLEHRGATPVPGPFPTYLALDADRRLLLCADHGGFEHVEKIVHHEDGTWGTEYVYDDSTVLVHRLAADGTIEELSDVVVLGGHGPDPNTSAQSGGHAQASAHAHSVTIDPSGTFLLVGDKGADRILVYRLGETLELASTYASEPQTGPRHLAFDPVSGRLYCDLEFASELLVLDFDAESGAISPVSRCSTLAGDVGRTNEPADLRVHPRGGLVYVNNRGEDAVAWFSIADDGTPRWMGSVPLAASAHPGVAARSIALAPDGALLLVTDRPAGLLRAYRVADDGSLTDAATLPVPGAAFVTVVV